MEEDGTIEARLDAIENVLGMLLMQLPKDGVRVMLADLQRLTDRAEKDPDIHPDSIYGLRRLHDLLQQWSAESPLTPRSRPVGRPANEDAP